MKECLVVLTEFEEHKHTKRKKGKEKAIKEDSETVLTFPNLTDKQNIKVKKNKKERERERQIH